jgi:hypothetical protein
MTVVW